MALYYRLLFPNQAFRQLEDIEQLVPFMYLSNNDKINTDKQQADSIPQTQPAENLIEDPIPPTPKPQTKNTKAKSTIYPKQPDSLFWCIYIARHGYQSYTEIGHRYGNTEIEEKQQIVEMMRASPSKIKECSKRITKAQYQEFMSDFMTNKKLTTEMLTVFAIYCNMRIWIVNLGNLEEPESWYMDICSNDTLHLQPTIIYRKNRTQYSIEVAEGDQLSDLTSKIKTQLFKFDNYDTPLKAISNYKISDLEDIADRLGIALEGKYKKQDVYDKIIQKLIIV